MDEFFSNRRPEFKFGDLFSSKKDASSSKEGVKFSVRMGASRNDVAMEASFPIDLNSGPVHLSGMAVLAYSIAEGKFTFGGDLHCALDIGPGEISFSSKMEFSSTGGSHAIYSLSEISVRDSVSLLGDFDDLKTNDPMFFPVRMAFGDDTDWTRFRGLEISSLTSTQRPTIIQPRLLGAFFQRSIKRTFFEAEEMADLEPIKRTFHKIMCVTDLWIEIARDIERDPRVLYGLNPRSFEEFVAGIYKKEGFEKVILTPRSNDEGRDVIAYNFGLFPQSIVVSVKQHKEGKCFEHDAVRALHGVMQADNATNGHLVTTGARPPLLFYDRLLTPLIGTRLSIITPIELQEWLGKLLASRSK